MSEPTDAAGPQETEEDEGDEAPEGGSRTVIARLARAMGLGSERLDRSDDVSRLSRHSWMAGLAGTAAVMGMGWLGSRRHVLERGWGFLRQDLLARCEQIWPQFFGPEGSGVDKNRVMVLVLLVTLLVMFLFELGIRLTVDRGSVLSIRKDWRSPAFLRECVTVYLAELGLLTFAMLVYRSVGEYGYRSGASPTPEGIGDRLAAFVKNLFFFPPADGGGGYYQPWFNIMGVVLHLYLVLGLPYVLLTRALQHDPRADRKQAAFTVIKAARYVAARLRLVSAPPPKVRAGKKDKRRRAAELALRLRPAWPFDKYDRTAMVGLLVKFFFVPLMTVFFCDQFFHLVKNYEFLLDAVPQRVPMRITTREMYDVCLSVIFSVDVGLAWAGYVASSRWIKNGMFSVEPTVLGWLVALLCYPPINRNFGLYFSTPGEHEFLSMDSKGAIIVFASFSIASFTLYTASTVCFGLRFSNLTHRGIITTGPYAIVRHPAYASKNFSWWCVMLPYAIYDAQKTHAYGTLLGHVVGLVALSSMYYWRAITEERHLRRDPEYRDYMKKVPWRFVPGLV